MDPLVGTHQSHAQSNDEFIITATPAASAGVTHEDNATQHSRDSRLPDSETTTPIMGSLLKPPKNTKPQSHLSHSSARSMFSLFSKYSNRKATSQFSSSIAGSLGAFSCANIDHKTKLPKDLQKGKIGFLGILKFPTMKSGPSTDDVQQPTDLKNTNLSYPFRFVFDVHHFDPDNRQISSQDNFDPYTPHRKMAIDDFKEEENIYQSQLSELIQQLGKASKLVDEDVLSSISTKFTEIQAITANFEESLEKCPDNFAIIDKLDDIVSRYGEYIKEYNLTYIKLAEAINKNRILLIELDCKIFELLTLPLKRLIHYRFFLQRVRGSNRLARMPRWAGAAINSIETLTPIIKNAYALFGMKDSFEDTVSFESILDISQCHCAIGGKWYPLFTHFATPYRNGAHPLPQSSTFISTYKFRYIDYEKSSRSVWKTFKKSEIKINRKMPSIDIEVDLFHDMVVFTAVNPEDQTKVLLFPPMPLSEIALKYKFDVTGPERSIELKLSQYKLIVIVGSKHEICDFCDKYQDHSEQMLQSDSLKIQYCPVELPTKYAEMSRTISESSKSSTTNEPPVKEPLSSIDEIRSAVQTIIQGRTEAKLVLMSKTGKDSTVPLPAVEIVTHLTNVPEQALKFEYFCMPYVKNPGEATWTKLAKSHFRIYSAFNKGYIRIDLEGTEKTIMTCILHPTSRFQLRNERSIEAQLYGTGIVLPYYFTFKTKQIAESAIAIIRNELGRYVISRVSEVQDELLIEPSEVFDDASVRQPFIHTRKGLEHAEGAILVENGVKKHSFGPVISVFDIRGPHSIPKSTRFILRSAICPEIVILDCELRPEAVGIKPQGQFNIEIRILKDNVFFSYVLFVSSDQQKSFMEKLHIQLSEAKARRDLASQLEESMRAAKEYDSAQTELKNDFESDSASSIRTDEILPSLQDISQKVILSSDTLNEQRHDEITEAYVIAARERVNLKLRNFSDELKTKYTDTLNFQTTLENAEKNNHKSDVDKKPPPVFSSTQTLNNLNMSAPQAELKASQPASHDKLEKIDSSSESIDTIILKPSPPIIQLPIRQGRVRETARRFESSNINDSFQELHRPSPRTVSLKHKVAMESKLNELKASLRSIEMERKNMQVDTSNLFQTLGDKLKQRDSLNHMEYDNIILPKKADSQISL